MHADYASWMVADFRVLFVGNSATFFNDLPEMLRRMVPRLRFGQVTKAGQSLIGHASDPSVRWMITGEGTPGNMPRFSHGQDFFADGEGWDMLILQDRADTIRNWTTSASSIVSASSAEMDTSLRALDTFASFVQTAKTKMKRRPHE